MPVNTDHFCSLCESRVPGFEHGGKSNDRKFCPNCRAKGRYRLIWLYLVRELGVGTRRIRMLHLAPERSLGERLFNLDKLDYLTADLMVPNVDIRLDLTKAGISNQAFDLIVCNHILEHIKEDGLALEELNRILREDGKLFLTVSTNRKQLTGEYRSSAASSFSDTSQDGHYREYGLDLADKLEDLGFSVKVVWYMRQFSQQEALRLGLKNEVFFICKKNQ